MEAARSGNVFFVSPILGFAFVWKVFFFGDGKLSSIPDLALRSARAVCRLVLTATMLRELFVGWRTS